MNDKQLVTFPLQFLETIMIRCFFIYAIVIFTSVITPSSFSTEYGKNYVLTVGHLHRYMVGVTDSNNTHQHGISLPRSSYYSHTFLRKDLSQYTVDHGYNNQNFEGFMIHYNSGDIAHLANDPEPRISGNPDTALEDWMLY